MVISVNKGALLRRLGAALAATAILLVAGCGEIHGRDEFNKEVMNKGEDDIVKSVGKPAAVDASNPERVTWTYYSITYNIENQNKMDQKTIVVLKRDQPGGKLRAIETRFE